MDDSVLIVEDDEKLSAVLKEKLERYGFNVHAHNGEADLLSFFEEVQPSIVLLDINLPTFDGFYWCRQIRQLSTCPVIFISARSSEIDQVMALEHGGDDYLPKPFHTDVLVAKVRSHIRRAYGEYSSAPEEKSIEIHGLVYHSDRMELTFNGETLLLSKKECQLMELLMKTYPNVVTRQAILDKLWDDTDFIDENTVNVNMARVRKQLQKLQIFDAVETIRGAGYRMHLTWERPS
ncbi:response regulator transcription factor [Alkalicoccobacillus murimartini]|uniref:DNA-binding response OmpR family regulator n=1 Tax=Alkalicoccobacillus murimartini TaxID=171685 RepID=A0ABT9YL92_9BACI|nr:response regulator transcription factor [Alkalicoccobacillus murimartini]MDQ0208363.1 DNA-binding response OmpR family regulator [Alkalicoccobacillus murimartini]